MASKRLQVTFVIQLMWQMFGLVWHHHEFLIITHWSLMDSLKPPKNGSKPQKRAFSGTFVTPFMPL